MCDLIPSHLVGKLSRKHGVDKKSRGFSAWSHVVSMLFAQISGAISLNDVCDNLLFARNDYPQMVPNL